MSRETITPLDLSALPEFVSHAELRKMGFTETGAKHLEQACGRCYRVGRYWYVRRDDLERVLAEREVRVL